MMRFFTLLLLSLLLAAAPAAAQDTSAQPLEILADQSLEWHRDDQRFIARGNASATQGPTAIHAQTLTAHYDETQKSSMDIQKLIAEGDVNIISQGNTATGQHAIYDVKTGKAEMTGDNLRLTSPDQTVTARDKFEYDVNAGRMTAFGNVVVLRGADKLTADQAAAIFATDANGKRTLRELTANGNVIITTPAETVRGQRGVYNAATNIATLTGHVRIERGPNVLEGERAEVNLNTNVSRMIGSQQDGGRVRGVFYPGSQDSGNMTNAPRGSDEAYVPPATPPVAVPPVQLTPPPAATQNVPPLRLTPPPSQNQQPHGQSSQGRMTAP